MSLIIRGGILAGAYLLLCSSYSGIRDIRHAKGEFDSWIQLFNFTEPSTKDLLEVWGVIRIWHIVTRKPRPVQVTEVPKPKPVLGY